MTFLLAACLVAFDQLSKAWVVRNVPLNQPDIPFAPLLSLTHTRNDGAAFGILRDVDLPVGGVHVDGTMLLGLLSAVVAIGLIVYLAANGRRIGAAQRVALGLVLAGAVGNMIDRLRLGYVVDFLHLQAGGFSIPLFNLADLCIVIGAVLLVLTGLRGPTDTAPSAGPIAGDGSDVGDAVADDDESGPMVYAVRSPQPPAAPRERKRPLDDYPDLPPFKRAGEAE